MAKEIRALKRMKDSNINLADIPEIQDWSGAVQGKFYRPAKKFPRRNPNNRK